MAILQLKSFSRCFVTRVLKPKFQSMRAVSSVIVPPYQEPQKMVLLADVVIVPPYQEPRKVALLVDEMSDRPSQVFVTYQHQFGPHLASDIIHDTSTTRGAALSKSPTLGGAPADQEYKGVEMENADDVIPNFTLQDEEPKKAAPPTENYATDVLPTAHILQEDKKERIN